MTSTEPPTAAPTAQPATVAPTASPTAEPPAPTPTASPTPEPTSAYPVLSLEPVDAVVRAYPGPIHYEGDRLTFEINAGEYAGSGKGPVTLQVDEGNPYQVTGEWQGNYLLVPVDTEGLVGSHRLTLQAEQNGVQVDEVYPLEVRPAAERPAQEQDPSWAVREVECCTLHYITDTAAARDIDWLAETVQKAADELEQNPHVDIQTKIDVYFIDRMWYNGAFGGNGELLATYTDRYYGPAQGQEGIEVVVKHELAHAADFPFFSYVEGLAVYLAGGHYKPEPIARRAAAMLDLNYYVIGRGPIVQHEAVYLYQAAVIDYLVETYGWDTLSDFMQADSEQPDASPEARDEILAQTVGVSREEFDRDFVAWLRAQDPGQQVRDLEMTVELQDLRRSYQDRYAPDPQFIRGTAADSFARPEYLSVNIREPHSPAHVATELLIANAQKALVAGRYDEAQALIAALDSVVTSGRLDQPLAREYGAVAYALAQRGYEAVSLDLHGDEAVVQATQSPPELETLTLERAGGLWKVDGVLVEPGPLPSAAPASPTSPPATLGPPEASPTDLPADTLYYDDFSDPESGWERHTEAKISVDYADGAYRIWIDFANAAYWFNVGESFDDVAIESQVTLQGGPDVDRFGLMCHYNPESGGMVQFLIDGRGRYGILWQEQGESTYLGAEGMQSSEALNAPGEPNVLRAVCTDDSLSLWANGQELLTVENTVSGGSGDVGVVVNTVGGAGLDVAYDYLLVTEP